MAWGQHVKAGVVWVALSTVASFVFGLIYGEPNVTEQAWLMAAACGIAGALGASVLAVVFSVLFEPHRAHNEAAEIINKLLAANADLAASAGIVKQYAIERITRLHRDGEDYCKSIFGKMPDESNTWFVRWDQDVQREIAVFSKVLWFTVDDYNSVNFGMASDDAKGEIYRKRKFVTGPNGDRGTSGERATLSIYENLVLNLDKLNSLLSSDPSRASGQVDSDSGAAPSSPSSPSA